MPTRFGTKTARASILFGLEWKKPSGHFREALTDYFWNADQRRHSHREKLVLDYLLKLIISARRSALREA
ncbi:hypothetical protein [Endozoicomonas sp. 8E]|uniref:hypothetical protein n=1 Tax=Endozoicomonas sp. 8E TaxID=3035692 RepID=UPI00293952B5|nr:hypothetical protein [Endozoicomonas sp. 8E]WOG30114.1 hypothetical protein P6910_10800 [Endozoicomonas sp. 8E]